MQLYVNTEDVSLALALVHAYTKNKGVSIVTSLSSPVLSDGNGTSVSGAGAIARCLARLSNQTTLLGEDSAFGFAVVDEWLSLCCQQGFGAGGAQKSTKKSAKKSAGGDCFLTMLNNELLTLSYLGGGVSISLADLFAYVAVHSRVASLSPADQASLGNLLRWFNHIQSDDCVKTFSLPHVPVQHSYSIFSNEPVSAASPATKRDQQKEKKQPVREKPAENPAKEKKEKPAKEKKEKKEKPAPAKGVDIGKLHVAVGRMVEVAAHPTEPRLYVTRIDVGEAQPRTVVCGVAEFLPIDALKGSLVLCILNIKAGNVKGVDSFGRCLVATGADGTKEMCRPDDACKVGERVTWPGVELVDGVASGKVFAKILKELHTDAERVVQYRDLPFTTSAGVVKVETIASGTVA